MWMLFVVDMAELEHMTEQGGQEEQQPILRVPQDATCGICFDSIIDRECGIPKGCPHTFCLRCIRRWMTSSNTCPIDRKRIECLFLYDEQGLRTGSESVTYRQESLGTSILFDAQNFMEDSDDGVPILYTRPTPDGWSLAMREVPAHLRERSRPSFWQSVPAGAEQYGWGSAHISGSGDPLHATADNVTNSFQVHRPRRETSLANVLEFMDDSDDEILDDIFHFGEGDGLVLVQISVLRTLMSTRSFERRMELFDQIVRTSHTPVSLNTS